MWIQFMDMHSGGSTKEGSYEHIYIEAGSEDEALIIFRNRFGHSPYMIGCDCCGENYSITVYETLEDATLYERETPKFGKELKTVKPLEEYLKSKTVLVIRAEDIKPEERTGSTGRGHYEWIED